MNEMSLHPSVSHPPPAAEIFHGAIRHPDLHLWDSWTFTKDGVLNLYCLALSRQTDTGKPITPPERNNFPFHIRHFKSQDGGQSWHDCGSFFAPNESIPFMNKNVWSGCMLPLQDDRVLFGFTGLKYVSPDKNFLQSIGIAISNGNQVLSTQTQPLSCPQRDYENIIQAGYYLGPKSELGSNTGEDGGPILAWRDPYFLETETGIEAFWSAKVSPQEGCIAHATLVETSDGFSIDKLHAPITLPQSEKATQVEVPKIYKTNGGYLLLTSTCDRLYENQPDSEVRKMLRLYKSDNIRGPWLPYHPEGSGITDNSQLFGASIVHHDNEGDKISLIAPITEMAPEELQLTFAEFTTINTRQTPKDLLAL